MIGMISARQHGKWFSRQAFRVDFQIGGKIGKNSA
jgi:hypothetical protein